MSPFEFWTRALDGGMAAAQTGFRFAEMMQAAQEVIASRCDTIAACARDPLGGDYAELGRMVPEKMSAFGSAATAAAEDLHALQSDAIANLRQLAGMALAGRPPTPAELDRLGNRAARMADRTLRAGGKALAPVHRTATGNARRLRKRLG